MVPTLTIFSKIGQNIESQSHSAYSCLVHISTLEVVQVPRCYLDRQTEKLITVTLSRMHADLIKQINNSFHTCYTHQSQRVTNKHVSHLPIHSYSLHKLHFLLPFYLARVVLASKGDTTITQMPFQVHTQYPLLGPYDPQLHNTYR